MKASADVAVVPIGAGESLSGYVAECQRILAEAGLAPRLHAFGTEVEGEWDTVTAAVRRCHERLHELGAPRLLTTMKLLTRTDREPTLDAPVADVQRALSEGSGSA